MENYPNLPDLPKEGMRKYYVYAADRYNREKYRLILADSQEEISYKPYYQYYNDGYLSYKYPNQVLVYNKSTNKWEENKEKESSFTYPVVYFNNFDLKCDGKITKEKTPLGAEIAIKEGNTLELKEGMVYSLQNYIDVLPKGALPRVTYESSNPDICTIDENGNIKALKEGECIITITNKNF
ncbi:Ig-like domain-containing protein [Clostridium perfringens]|uniref:BIG2 domain-containing protein n=1 Tax=Clostridium perfringens TaxID=1502 RepID=A0A133MP84_CLOPF|nr:Ig-like domain-containing protein [Clostridium perfringens]KXA05847.1 hypothetical protein HMPREF3222_02962 [Clostridium perfringens]